ncbi:hypothetical protein GQ457_09G018350 [Hibiscus cannabinus]
MATMNPYPFSNLEAHIKHQKGSNNSYSNEDRHQNYTHHLSDIIITIQIITASKSCFSWSSTPAIGFDRGKYSILVRFLTIGWHDRSVWHKRSTVVARVGNYLKQRILSSTGSSNWNSVAKASPLQPIASNSEELIEEGFFEEDIVTKDGRENSMKARVNIVNLEPAKDMFSTKGIYHMISSMTKAEL